MNEDNIWRQVSLQSWKYRVRTKKIRGVFLHSTRSSQPFTPAQEYGATINWFVSPSNQQSSGNEIYAAMASRIIGGGRHCIVMPDTFYPAYSAGHADPEVISIEFAQPTRESPYAPEDITLGVEVVAGICTQYGIDPKKIVYLNGDNRELPGIARHDRSANGTKYGKSDPGPPFPDDFEDRVRAAMEGEDMTTERVWDGSRTWIVGKGGSSLITYPEMDKPLQAIYGPHTRAMTPAELEAIKVK